MGKLFGLEQELIPKKWFNVMPHLTEPVSAPLDSNNEYGSSLKLMRQIRLKKLLEQDELQDSWVDIPKDVLDKYLEIGRPTPLMRAKNLEEYLETPAKIYIKREDLLTTGSFKLNTAIAQAYYAKLEGAKGLVSETGAGQWGLAIAYACRTYGLRSRIYWVKVSCHQKPYRALFAKMLGCTIIPSPSDSTEAGRKILEKDPDCPGSIGTGISEAINFAKDNKEFNYVSGSNLPHVLLHQTIIGLETKIQLEKLDEKPDVLIACVGGGSNLGGFMSPFLPDKLSNGNHLRLLAAESDAAPRLTRGEYKYDHSDPVGLTPRVLSYTLGMDYVPPPVHVGGLRQHNGSPIIGSLRHSGLLEAHSYSQEDTFKAGELFVKCERFIPAPETNHAIKAVIDMALECKKKREKKTIVACFSGSGILDILGYKEILTNLTDN